MSLGYRKTGIAPDGYTIVPPDGRWGWLVLIGCYICGGVICFPIVTFAVTMNDIKSTFNINTSTVSWTIAALSAVGGTLGPFAVVIADTFSSRKCSILGAIFFSLTFIITSYVTNIIQMIITFGLIGGLGQALLYVPLSSVLSGYFRDYYTIVSGIYSSCFAMAKMALTPLADYLNAEYGWRGCMLIFGGLSLNACAAAALFQPPKWHRKLKPVQKSNMIQLSHQNEHLEQPNCIYNDENININDNEQPINEVSNCPQQQIDQLHEVYGQTYGNNDPNMSLSGQNHDLTEDNCHSLEKNGNCLSTTNIQLSKPPPNVNENIKLDRGQTFSEKLKKVMDPALLKMVNFYMFSLTYSVTISVMACSSGYFFSHGLDAGMEARKSAWFASTIAIGEMLGRMGGPMLTKIFRLSSTVAFIIALGLSSVVFFGLSFMTSHVMLFVTGGLLGFVFGCCLGLNFGIITELVGEVKVLPTMGFSVLFQGLFILALGPFSGWLYDVTGSYGNCFMLYGGVLAITSVAWIFYWKLK
ncbi:hypothetical protein CHUAL_000161 [Chamberlinius hualienensis]